MLYIGRSNRPQKATTEEGRRTRVRSALHAALTIRKQRSVPHTELPSPAAWERGRGEGSLGTAVAYGNTYGVGVRALLPTAPVKGNAPGMIQISHSSNLSTLKGHLVNGG